MSIINKLWKRLPSISVILPVFNGGDYLAESIESVLAQKDVSLELIVVNDGSTDNTSKTLTSYPSIKVVSQENRGIAKALNSGHKLARGEYITWTSADNRYLPGALKKLSDVLAKNPQTALCYANVRLIDENGAPLRNSSYRVPDQDPNDNSILHLPNKP